jgi:hypothetical protein
MFASFTAWVNTTPIHIRKLDVVAIYVATKESDTERFAGATTLVLRDGTIAYVRDKPEIAVKRINLDG